LVAATVRVEVFPATMVAGFAVMVTVGEGLAVTVTVTVDDAVPPGPEADAV
jgi:hypothetical protein